METSNNNPLIENKSEKKFPITTNTRIQALLDADLEGVISALVKLSSNFSKLKNPTLRTLLAPRVSIAQACRVAHCEPQAFLTAMEQLGFLIVAEKEEAPVQVSEQPTACDRRVFDLVLSRFDSQKVSYIDVCHLEMPQPMLLIIDHIGKLKSDEVLYICHKKVPVFLLPELDKKGLRYSLLRRSAERYDMLIYKK